MRRAIARSFVAPGRRCLATASAPSLATSSTTVKTASPTAVQLPPRLATRNVLKAAIDLAKRTVVAPEVLSSTVDQMLQDLQQPRKPIVAFWGDSHSGATDIVTALLEDPLSDDQSRRNTLVGRHDAQNQPVLRIRSSDSTTTLEGDNLALHSSWLQNAGFDVVEITDSDPSESLPELLSSDHLVLVTDNVRFLSGSPTLAKLVTTFASHPSLHIVLNRINTKSTTSLMDEQVLASQLADLFPGELPLGLKVDVVSSTDALEALDLFRSTTSGASSSATAARLELYQQKSISSSIAKLSSNIISATTSPASIEEIQLRTGTFLASYILAEAQARIDVARYEAVEAEHRVKVLREEVRAQTLAAREEFDEGDMEVVKRDVARSKAAARRALDAFPWWSLPWKVDDVGTVVRDAAVDDYGRELESKIHYHSGRLASLQTGLATLTSRTTSFPVGSPFYSPILLNTLARHNTPLPSSSSSSPLLAPITLRRSQIIDSLVPGLQVRTQRAVASFYVGSFGSAAMAWASCVIGGWVDAEVALGLGLVGVVGSVRWVLIRGWEKAGRRFWEGWDRVGSGLSRDVKATHDEKVLPEVTRKAVIAADGLDALVLKRMQDVDEVDEERRRVVKMLPVDTP